MLRLNVVPIILSAWLLVAHAGAACADQIGLQPKIAEILAVDEAFRFGSYEQEDQLHLFWQVMPGYYLYRDKIRIRQGDLELPLDLPTGEWRDDEVFGEVLVLEGLVELMIPLSRANLVTEVSYQGCASKGYCYPPQKKSLSSEKSGLSSKKSPF